MERIHALILLSQSASLFAVQFPGIKLKTKFRRLNRGSRLTKENRRINRRGGFFRLESRHFQAVSIFVIFPRYWTLLLSIVSEERKVCPEEEVIL